MIYKDINVLTTPLLYYIGIIMFRILGVNYLTYRIYNLIITIFLHTSIYVLLKKMNISKTHSVLYTIIISMILRLLIGYGANYNVLALAFTIIGIILTIEKYVNKKEIKYYNVLQGLITFLIIFTKQNIGAYYFLANILVEIVINKKNFVKNILKQLFPIIVLGFMYLFYLYINNSLYNFIDYTILGMKEFATNNKFVYWNLLPVYLAMFAFIIFVILKERKEEKNINIEKILIIYSIIYLLIAFPILEIFHSLVAGIPLIITFIYCLHIGLIQDMEIKVSILKKIIIFVLLFVTISTGFTMWYWNIYNIKDKESIYYGALYLEEEQEALEKITKFIENSEEEVVILCPEAAIYNMPLGIDNGILDLPTQGNVGKEGAKKIINILSNLKQTKILMTEKKKYWQEYDEVRNYVTNNFEKIDEIESEMQGYIIKYNVYFTK